MSICGFSVQLLSAFLDVICKLHINYALSHNCHRIFLSIWVSDFCFFDQHISLSKFQSSFCSKRVRGGGGCTGDHNAQEYLEEVQQQLKKKQQHSETMMPARWKRPINQAEHIARERQRRDNMTNRFSTLETLLPSGPKVTTTMM